MNPALWLQRTAKGMPDAPALFKGDTPVANYATFAHRAAAIAAALDKRGIAKGDRVALFSRNCTEYLEALYGIWWHGAIAVPINGKLHPREAGWIVDDAGARLLFVDDTFASDGKSDTATDIPAIPLQDAAFDEMRNASRLSSPARLDAEETAWLFYTSGTTGRPKGVMITAGNIASMALSYFVDVDTVEAQDAALYAAPMSHGAGLYNFMHVMRGARHVVPESGGFDASEILTLSAEIGRVSMFAAPTMVRRLVDTAKASGQSGKGLRTIVYAGGPMYEADILDAVELLGPRFVQIYGQGECPMGITALPRHAIADRRHPRWRERLNSVGCAQTEVDVAVLDAAGNPSPHDEVGEIVVRGRTVMKGYWQNPEATANTLRDGWLRTGDLGRLDKEGYLTLQDRSKDLIISGGSNIYPREVEEALLAHPGVQEAAIVGMADATWGEIVVAFVVCGPQARVEENALDAFCLQRIARFKRPKRYVFVNALPKNNYGKVLKTELRKKLATSSG